MKTTLTRIASAALLLSACTNSNKNLDASGSFEAEEILISAEASGKLMAFTIQEGQVLQAGQYIGYIDSLQLYLKKKQIEAQIQALLSKKPNIAVQIASLEEQIKTNEKEQERLQHLLKADAATGKQVDDIRASIEILKKQLDAQRSSLSIASEGITQETRPLQIQIEQLNDQLQKCKLLNSVYGTVLTTYASAHEMASQGKPLYKIADLSSLILRVYVTGDQLPQLRLNQNVKVKTDDGHGGFTETNGTLIYINDKAEFTPKTIQTKDERANLVYAVKIKVKNDGRYKIGMYGEIVFN